MTKQLRVLISCEFSGRVRSCFEKRGWDAWSCDLLPTEIPGQHFLGDVTPHLSETWDLLIAFPPCTRLCNSGVRWLAERNLWTEMEEGAKFFKAHLDANIKYIAAENPIMHKYARAIIKIPYSQIIQPWMFGHGETKATCLHLKNLPNLLKTKVVEGRRQSIHLMSPGPNRSKLRSTTYWGIAEAMADQWGTYIENKELNHVR
jgi:hypothetical protein